MARFRDLLSSFLLGEVSPGVLGRADLDQYKQMCEELTNMIVVPQGGVRRRPGTQFLLSDAVFNTQNALKIVPFVISKTESYIVIFTTSSPGLEDLGTYIYDVTAGTIVAVTAAIYPQSAYYCPQFRGFDTATELQELQFAQFGNTIFFAQKDHPPFAIQRRGANWNAWPFWNFGRLSTVGTYIDEIVTETADGWPYTSRNTTTYTITPSGTTGAITLTASNGIFTSDQVGLLLRITNTGGTQTGVVRITGYTSSTVLTGTVLVSLGTVTSSTNWAFTSWGGAKGWPRAIAFFQNRVVYGGSLSQPNTIWASATGNVAKMRQEHFVQSSDGTLNNADPVEFTISSTEINQIQWLSPGKTLAIGTLGREYTAYGPDPAQAMGPLNVTFNAETAYGSKAVQPVRRDNALIFAQRSGRKVREFIFNFAEDAYKAENLMVYAEHMNRRTGDLLDAGPVATGEIVEIAHQEADNQLTWFRDSNKGLFALTRDKDMGITGFHYHPIGGNQLGGQIAQILTICTCPSADGTHDDLYMMVRRDINNSTYTYLERINRDFELTALYNPFTDITSKPIYVDSAAMSRPASATSVHSGWSHLIGEEVHVIADGIYQGIKVVSALGQITLTVSASEVIAGIGYRSLIKPAPINMGSVIGTSQGAEKTIDQVTFRFVRTLGAKFGLRSDDLYDIDFRDPNAVQNDPIALFTGDKELSPPQGWDHKVQLIVVQDLPFPMELSAMIARGVVYD